VFKSLDGSIEGFDESDVPPPKVGIPLPPDVFGVSSQAVQFTIGKRRERYVSGFRTCSRTSPWQYDRLLIEHSVSDAWVFHEKHELKRPRKLTAVRARTNQPEPPKVPADSLKGTLNTLKGCSKAKTLVKFLARQSGRKATLLQVTNHLYVKGNRVATVRDRNKAKQLIRRTALTLSHVEARWRLEFDWDRDEIALTDAP
jgi:hypothetical protein